MKESANRGGMIFFTVSMIATVVFFVFVVASQPGPIDQVKKPAPGMTQAQYKDLKRQWGKATPEKVVRGKKLFETMFSIFEGGTDFIIENFKSGELKNHTGEISVFRLAGNGFSLDGRGQTDYISQEDRWNITHYIRSVLDNPKTSSDSDWKDYLNENL